MGEYQKRSSPSDDISMSRIGSTTLIAYIMQTEPKKTANIKEKMKTQQIFFNVVLEKRKKETKRRNHLQFNTTIKKN